MVQRARQGIDSLTEDKLNEIKNLLTMNTAYLKIARALKVNAITIRNIDIQENKKHVITEDGYGRKEIRNKIVARRYIDDPWPDKDAEMIEQLRVDYDKGIIDIATGRDGFWQMLYRYPRAVKAKRQPYFNREEGN